MAKGKLRIVLKDTTYEAGIKGLEVRVRQPETGLEEIKQTDSGGRATFDGIDVGKKVYYEVNPAGFDSKPAPRPPIGGIIEINSYALTALWQKTILTTKNVGDLRNGKVITGTDGNKYKLSKDAPDHPDTYLITIVVRDYDTKKVLPGARVTQSRTGALGTYTKTEMTNIKGEAYFNPSISQPKGVVGVTRTGYNGTIQGVYSMTHYVNLKPKTGLPHKLTFNIREDDTFEPIEGVSVSVNKVKRVTPASGSLVFELVEGLYPYVIEKEGYEGDSGRIHMPDRDKETTTELKGEGEDGGLAPPESPEGRIRIKVLDSKGKPMAGIMVYVEQSASNYGRNIKTDSKGEVTSGWLWSGEYVKFQANLGMYRGHKGSGWIQSTILPGETTLRTVELKKK